jgi:hypothetical protein
MHSKENKSTEIKNSVDLIIVTQEADLTLTELVPCAQHTIQFQPTEEIVSQQYAMAETKLFNKMDNAEHAHKPKCQTQLEEPVLLDLCHNHLSQLMEEERRLDW